MIVENDINKVNQILKEKVVKEVYRDEEGLIFVFKDGTKFKFKSYFYQMLLG